MSERLSELLRQRAAIQAHLAWLDCEIAQTRSATPQAPSATPDQAVSPAPASPTSDSTPAVEAEANAILAQYRQDSTHLRENLRSGCLLYFFGAFLLLAVAVTAFYFLNRTFKSEPEDPPASVSSERP